jgi:2'-hydroxyisoflavone reductase
VSYALGPCACWYWAAPGSSVAKPPASRSSCPSSGPAPFGDLLSAIDASADLVWVSTPDLLAAKVDPWMGVPLWIGDPEWAAANPVDNSRAVAAGLTTRPPADTAADVLAWDTARGGPSAEPFTADQEQALLPRRRS